MPKRIPGALCLAVSITVCLLAPVAPSHGQCEFDESRLLPGEAIVGSDPGDHVILDLSESGEGRADRVRDFLVTGWVCAESGGAPLAQVKVTLTAFARTNESTKKTPDPEDLLQAPSGGFVVTDTRTTRLNGDGWFRFAGLAPGSYALSVDWTNIDHGRGGIIWNIRQEKPYVRSRSVPGAIPIGDGDDR